MNNTKVCKIKVLIGGLYIKASVIATRFASLVRICLAVLEIYAGTFLKFDACIFDTVRLIALWKEVI